VSHNQKLGSYILHFPIAAVPYTRVGTSKFGFKFIPKKENEYRNTLRKLALPQWRVKPLTAPLKVDIIFSFVKAKTSKLSHHIKRPDTSNLIKSIEDTFNKILWEDDCQIIELHARKIFGPEDSITLQITEII
jgi:Holliday junction resolvase RusA-like endonuclease